MIGNPEGISRSKLLSEKDLALDLLSAKSALGDSKSDKQVAAHLKEIHLLRGALGENGEANPMSIIEKYEASKR